MTEEKIDFEESKIEEEKKSNKKKWISLEMIFLLILGILLGVVLKTEAVKRLTVGFSDYKLSSMRQSFDFAEMEKRVDEQTAQSQAAGQDQNNQ